MVGKLSLEFTVVGLGQCGGLMASSFASRGYRAVAINTSTTDLHALSMLPEDRKLYIGIDGRDGTGKDAALGEISLRDATARIREAVSQLSAETDALLLCGGLGGGTGSGLPSLVQALLPLGRPTLVAFAIPGQDEPGPVKVNAIRAADRLMSSGAHGFIALDADAMHDTVAGANLDAFMRTAGDAFADSFNEVNTLATRGDLHSLRTFDGEDLRRVLFAGRYVTMGQVDLDATDKLDGDVLVDAFVRCAGGEGPFVPGHHVERASFASVVVMASQAVLAATPGRVFEHALARIRERVGGAALYVGLYAHVSSRPRLLAIASGMPIPTRLHQFTSIARQEATEFCRKLGAPQARLDVNPLKGLSLFGRGVRGAGAAQG